MGELPVILDGQQWIGGAADEDVRIGKNPGCPADQHCARAETAPERNLCGGRPDETLGQRIQ